MGTTLIESKRRSGDIRKLTSGMKVFCEEMAADPQMNTMRAAEKAGYKNPSQAGWRLLKQPTIRAYLGKILHERVMRCRLVADDVLTQLRNALFLDPLDLFEPVGNGVYLVKSLDQIPQEIRRCITKLKTVTYQYEDGTIETKLEIELMSKDSAMTNAMKHLGLEYRKDLQAFDKEPEDNPYVNAPAELLLKAKDAITQLKESVNGHLHREID